MNKEGDYLTLIKEMPPPKCAYPSYQTTPRYTMGQRYKIMFINDKGTLYLANNDTPEHIKTYSEYVENGEMTEKEKMKHIKNHCTIWFPSHVEEYFVNIQEKRKEKIANIKKKFKC